MKNKYDFKNYLLETKKEYSQDDLIFWRRKIPLPLDLIYRLFEDRHLLLYIYINHLMAAVIYSKIVHRLQEPTPIEKLPDNKAISSCQVEIMHQIRRYIDEQPAIFNLAENIAQLFGLVDYELVSSNLIEALSHDGKKYERIFIPVEVKELINEINPSLLLKIAVSNGDMFGNVVCDHFGIYRGGLSDAFAAIFTDLMKFQILSKGRDLTGKSKVEFETYGENLSDEYVVEFASSLSGKIWEPMYKNGRIGIRINTSHVFVNSLTSAELMKLIPFFVSSCEDEFNSYNDNKTRILEEFRESVSRSTRLKLER